jgi:PAS domain S-box-containing protein
MEDGVNFQGAGAMRDALAAADWARSPVGPPAQWSPTLKAALALILPAQAEIVLFWGSEFVAFYNEAYAPTIGLKHPAALGRPAREFWAELWSDLGPLLAGVRETGKTLSAKDRPFYIERTGIGETVYFDISYSAVREPDGAIGGVLCIVAETTTRVLAQQRLASERQRLSQLFEQAPSFMALLEGPEHRFALVNPAYRQLLGRDDLLGRTVREAAPEVVAQGFLDLLDRVYASGEPFRGRAQPLELVREAGGAAERFHLDFVYQPIKDAAGAVNGIFVEGSDVTEAVRAAAELAESEEKFRSFAQTVPNMFWTAKADIVFRPASATRSSSACAVMTGPTAGIWRAPCRSATRRAWCAAGSAPTPTFRTKRTSPPRSPTSTPRWRRASPTARVSCWRPKRLCASRRRWRRSGN